MDKKFMKNGVVDEKFIILDEFLDFERSIIDNCGDWVECVFDVGNE